MELKLKNTLDDSVKSFLGMKTRLDIANTLEIDDDKLIFYVYVKKNQYKEIEILKKNGGKRRVLAPLGGIKILQRKIATIIGEIYKPRKCVHSYCKDRSIRSNASVHVRKNIIIKADLKDFFGTVNFGRVRGLFLNKPFNLSPEVATVLAQICTHNNQLPQGAPSSPIISNMIANQLDSGLTKLAKFYGLHYSRYSDDITLSTNKKTLSEKVAAYDILNNQYRAGEHFEKVISKSGFKNNQEKFRVLKKERKQSVNGLVVNKKVNIDRVFIRQVRAMLHAWEKYGEHDANKKMLEKFYTKKTADFKPTASFKEVLLGKINFIKMIRGHKDPVFVKFFNKYIDISKERWMKLPLNQAEEILRSTWKVEVGTSEGTGFALKDFGIVTCAHVVKDRKAGEEIKVTNSEYGEQIVDLKTSNEDIDLAILDFRVKGLNPFHFKTINTKKPITGEKITFAGFSPPKALNHKPDIIDTKVLKPGTLFGLEHIFISGIIYKGQSGGPVLNEKNEVIGVVSRGIHRGQKVEESTDNAFIPIEHLLTVQSGTETPASSPEKAGISQT